MPAFSITPGFDFGVNDKPTRATLIDQALSLRIIGLTEGEIDPSIPTILFGDVSNDTGALQAASPRATLWNAPNGDLFVVEQSGHQKLWRYEGGWETQRYFVQHQDVPEEPGGPLTIDAGEFGGDEAFIRTTPPDTHHSGSPVMEVFEVRFDGTQSGRCVGITADTPSSSYTRWVGRGLTMTRDPSPGNALAILTSVEYKDDFQLGWGSGGAPAVWYSKQPMTGTLTPKRFQTIHLTPGPDASQESVGLSDTPWRVESLAWNFGLFQWCNRT